MISRIPGNRIPAAVGLDQQAHHRRGIELVEDGRNLLVQSQLPHIAHHPGDAFRSQSFADGVHDCQRRHTEPLATLGILIHIPGMVF